MSEEPRDFVEGEVLEGDARGAVPEVVEPERVGCKNPSGRCEG